LKSLKDKWSLALLGGASALVACAGSRQVPEAEGSERREAAGGGEASGSLEVGSGGDAMTPAPSRPPGEEVLAPCGEMDGDLRPQVSTFIQAFNRWDAVTLDSFVPPARGVLMVHQWHGADSNVSQFASYEELRAAPESEMSTSRPTLRPPQADWYCPFACGGPATLGARPLDADRLGEWLPAAPPDVVAAARCAEGFYQDPQARLVVVFGMSEGRLRSLLVVRQRECPDSFHWDGRQDAPRSRCGEDHDGKAFLDEG